MLITKWPLVLFRVEFLWSLVLLLGHTTCVVFQIIPFPKNCFLFGTSLIMPNARTFLLHFYLLISRRQLTGYIGVSFHPLRGCTARLPSFFCTECIKKKVNNYKMAYKSNMDPNFRQSFCEYGYFKVF